MSTSASDVRLLTVKELAMKTGIPKWRWHSLLASGCGPAALRVGRTWRVSEASLLAWIEQQQAQQGAQA
jgi:excisionase family DNA binding protein